MNVLFPEELTRLQYLGRWLIFVVSSMILAVILAVVLHAIGAPDWVFVAIIVPFVLLRFPCLDIPRLRSIGWSPWLVLLLFIPAVNLVVQLGLFLTPPDSTTSNY